MLRYIALVLLILTLAASGCQVVRPPAPPAPASSATPTSTGRLIAPTSAPTLISPLSPVTRRPVTLTVWLPDTLALSGNVTATMVLNQQIAAFVAAQPDVHVQALVKRAHGPGGILDLMQTAAPVAPTALPDVTLLDLASVSLAVQAELLRPLNNLLPEEALADMFPFAEAGRVDERWWAVAYAVDLEHVVYPAARISSPPVTWTLIISGSWSYLFPAGATSGTSADALLVHYVAAGGRWLDANGQPALDVAALTQMLRQFKEAQQAGSVPATVLNLNSPDDTWMAYLKMPVQIAHVRASRFVTQRLALTNTLTAALPGYGEPAQLIARGWAFVVSARDPARVSVAAALIRWLVSAHNEGTWTKAANLIPARRGSFEYWYPPDRYTAFLRRELERAISPPPTQVAQVIGPAIQKAVADVLRGLAQPAEAATTAAAGVSRQPR